MSADVAQELLEFGAATVGESGGRVMEPRMRAAWQGSSLCAPVYTVACAPGDNLAVHVAVTRAPGGAALVVSVGGAEGFGYWGEVLTRAAIARGLLGLVIEGGVRDVAALEAHRFPVFSTKIALKGASKLAGGHSGGPVEVGGVEVRSGDWVVADADGVAVVSKEKLHEVLTASRARADKERRLFDELASGKTTVELLGLDPAAVEALPADE
jgi:4-hydroxy-4-methyl-2-oxoglutarate aldolase